MKKYKSIDLARLFHLHPNTIKFYEKAGYISKAEREANNYRVFTELHVLQLQICRCIFGYPFMNRRIRNAGNLVIQAAVQGELSLGKQNAIKYIEVIQNEMMKAQKTADILQLWASKRPIAANDINSLNMYTRKEAAVILGVTAEAVRNWERNHLITSKKLENKSEKLFYESDIERMRIIYMLLQTGYSISSIHRCLSAFDTGASNTLLSLLHDPDHEEVISAGDRWLYELIKLEQAAKSIPLIFEKMAF